MHATHIAEHALSLGQCALAALQRRFPNKLGHVTLDANDRPVPSEIHPAFDGCYDWHSSVHMHRSLLRLCRMVPQLWTQLDVEPHFASRFTTSNISRELAYLQTPGRETFERPYGWAWLLMLQLELDMQSAMPNVSPAVSDWAVALRPLSSLLALDLASFLTRETHPVRAGTHSNSAFAMKLALDYARACGNSQLQSAVAQSARAWFIDDARYPAAYEPSGTDFLSPGLCEALLMCDVLGEDFSDWWTRFEPDPAGMSRWMQPATVSDRKDPQSVHLDGLNLSRAWCLTALAKHLPQHAVSFEAAAWRHWNASWHQVTNGDFVATHWLLSFALLACGDE